MPRFDKMGEIHLVKIGTALISVSNKEGITDFARGLKELGVEIISTGGTATLLERHGIKSTGSLSLQDGRSCLTAG